ncbi:protein-glutamine gamma-glutamyltransferase K-like [Glandiceps talaboti]
MTSLPVLPRTSGCGGRDERVRRNIPSTGRRCEQPVTTKITDIDNTLLSMLRRYLFDWWSPKPIMQPRTVLDNKENKPKIAKLPVVKSVDLKCEANRAAHHTSDYEVTNLIIRRGQSFYIVVEFEQPVNLDEQEVNLEILLGESPSLKKDTLIRIPFNGEDYSGKWEVQVMKASGSTMSLSILSPSSAIVGKCFLNLSVRAGKTDNGLEEYVSLWQSKPVYMLFNPWCKEDAVYLDSEEQLEEYVLNDTGFIYVGSHRNPTGRPWNFGQFEDEVFEATMNLLESGLAVQGRSNPVKVCRRMSAMVNCQDDDGVLVGNWSGEYADGIKPTDWVGSVSILRDYGKSKQPVCYGQCWVFSGVTTSVLRCLGIPARSVTNFGSAHDTDCSMTIDMYWDEESNPITDWNSDSIWNFHVWNECWMARPDLPTGYGGWQLVDGTPQETSDGVYQTGPASLMAIKQGHVYYNYDTEFGFAEVNADKVHWRANLKDNSLAAKKKVYVEKSRVGKAILTKAVGVDQSEDVTNLYKFPEGSAEERLAVQHACSHGSKPETYVTDKSEYDIKCQVMMKENVKIGDDFDVTVKLQNEGMKSCTITHLFISCHMCQYTGVVVKRCQKGKFDYVTVKPNETTEVSLHVHHTDYIDVSLEHATMKTYVLGQIEESNEIFAEQDDFSLTPPSLDIKVKESSTATVGGQIPVSVSFVNPLDKSLTDLKFILEGPGIQKTKIITHRNVKSKQVANINISLTPQKAGKRKLIASLHSKELFGITGYVDLEIKPSV